MKLFLATVLTACALFVTTNVFAFTVPTPTGHITDTANKLSADQLGKLEATALKFKESTGNEFAALITDTLDGDSIDDVAFKTFNTWKVGKAGLDNGVLLVLAVKEHKSRIETGKGVGGELTDLQTQDILIRMRPFLRSGDFYGAVNFGMLEATSKLDSRKGQKADPGQGARFNQPVSSGEVPATGNAPSCSISSTATEAGYGFGLIAFFAIGVILVVRYLIRSRKREEAALQAELDRKARLYLDATEKVKAPKQTLAFPKKVAASKVSSLPTPSSYRRSYPANPPAYVPTPPPPAPVKKPSYSYDSDSSSSSSSSYSSGSSDTGSSWGGSDSGGFGGGDSGGGGSSSDW